MKDIVVAIFLVAIAIIDVMDKPKSNKWSWMLIGVLILIWFNVISL